MAVNPLVFLLLPIYPRQSIPEASILELPTGTGKIHSKNSLDKGQGKWWPKIKGLLGNVCPTSARHQWKNHRETYRHSLMVLTEPIRRSIFHLTLPPSRSKLQYLESLTW